MDMLGDYSDQLLSVHRLVTILTDIFSLLALSDKTIKMQFTAHRVSMLPRGGVSSRGGSRISGKGVHICTCV